VEEDKQQCAARHRAFRSKSIEERKKEPMLQQEKQRLEQDKQPQ
jgi:hypothetical protein